MEDNFWPLLRHLAACIESDLPNKNRVRLFAKQLASEPLRQREAKLQDVEYVRLSLIELLAACEVEISVKH
jgi:hypothetical protein